MALQLARCLCLCWVGGGKAEQHRFTHARTRECEAQYFSSLYVFFVIQPVFIHIFVSSALCATQELMCTKRFLSFSFSLSYGKHFLRFLTFFLWSRFSPCFCSFFLFFSSVWTTYLQLRFLWLWEGSYSWCPLRSRVLCECEAVLCLGMFCWVIHRNAKKWRPSPVHHQQRLTKHCEHFTSHHHHHHIFLLALSDAARRNPLSPVAQCWVVVRGLVEKFHSGKYIVLSDVEGVRNLRLLACLLARLHLPPAYGTMRRNSLGSPTWKIKREAIKRHDAERGRGAWGAGGVGAGPSRPARQHHPTTRPHLSLFFPTSSAAPRLPFYFPGEGQLDNVGVGEPDSTTKRDTPNARTQTHTHTHTVVCAA